LFSRTRLSPGSFGREVADETARYIEYRRVGQGT